MVNTDTIQICSIDIGKKNFSFYIQEINTVKLSNIINIPEKDRYNIDGTPTLKMETLLSEIYKNGKTILYTNNDITENCDPNLYFDQELLHNLNDLLDSYLDYFDKCSYFVIEQQMNFGKFKRNSMALKLSHHCLSYFTFKYGRFKQYIEFPAYHKTQVLGAPKIKGKKYKNGTHKWISMSKNQRKKWSITKAENILNIRGENDIWNNIKLKRKKLDDISDCITMLQSFIYLYLINNKL